MGYKTEKLNLFI